MTWSGEKFFGKKIISTYRDPEQGTLDVIPIGTITPLPLGKSLIPCQPFLSEYSKLWVAYDTAHWKPASALSCFKSTDYKQTTRNGL